jgi:hypothetical protein
LNKGWVIVAAGGVGEKDLGYGRDFVVLQKDS